MDYFFAEIQNLQINFRKKNKKILSLPKIQKKIKRKINIKPLFFMLKLKI